MPDLAHFPCIHLKTWSSMRLPGLMHSFRGFFVGIESSNSGSSALFVGRMCCGMRRFQAFMYVSCMSFMNPGMSFFRFSRSASQLYPAACVSAPKQSTAKSVLARIFIRCSSKASSHLKLSPSVFFNAPAVPASGVLSSLAGGSVNLGGGTYFPIISHAGKSSTWPMPDRRAFFIAFRSGLPRPFRKSGLGAPGPVARDPFVSARLLLPLIGVEERHA